jgi:hypothetical protein
MVYCWGLNPLCGTNKNNKIKYIRDASVLLQSALDRPLNHFAHESKDIVELAGGTLEEKGFCEFLRANSKRTRASG